MAEKNNGAKEQLTNDNILRKFRFCNVYRELDRQTIEIHEDLKYYQKKFNLWLLNLAFHRFVAKPITVAKIGHLSFDLRNNTKVFKKLLNLKAPKYGSAYVFPISIIQKSKYPTREEFFCFYLPKIIQDVSTVVIQLNASTVNQSLNQILPIFGFNFRFHWTEILIDIAYLKPNLINLYKDFYIGPGAKPTIQHLKGKSISIKDLVETKLPNFPYLTFEGKPVYLSAENWEGIACEFRKYTNLSNGFGRRRLYKRE